MNIETLEATTIRELGILLKDMLNKGYSLYKFVEKDNKFYAHMSVDETPLVELSNEEFKERLQKLEKENALKKYGLDSN